MKKSNVLNHNKLCLLVGLACMSTTAFANEYVRIPDAAISGYNNIKLDNKSVSQCKSACNETPNCKSFDYHKNTSKCDLSYSSAEDVGGLKLDYSGDPFDHYAKLDGDLTEVTLFPNSALSGYNTKVLSGKTLSQCETACIDESSFSCHTFDYDAASDKCYLSDASAQTLNSNAQEVGLFGSSRYDHYVVSRRCDSISPVVQFPWIGMELLIQDTTTGKFMVQNGASVEFQNIDATNHQRPYIKHLFQTEQVAMIGYPNYRLKAPAEGPYADLNIHLDGNHLLNVPQLNQNQPFDSNSAWLYFDNNGQMRAFVGDFNNNVGCRINSNNKVECSSDVTNDEAINARLSYCDI